ncbi:MAG: hypothetical protein RIQ56_636 [Candidatus Parcubacteria bacterium]|jgi:penicillin-binding protein 2
MSRFFARKKVREIAPDEIFLDSSNLPEYDAEQFEGRVERPVSGRAILAVGLFFFAMFSAFSWRVYALQVSDGQKYADISKNNTIDSELVFATRGMIYDVTKRELAWSEMPLAIEATSTATTTTYALRKYTALPGLSHILGWVRYPKKDKSGTWWREDYVGMSGVELSYDSLLSGENGSRMIETDARGRVQRSNIVSPPENGRDVRLSIDADVQSKLYTVLSEHARKQGFVGGASAIMNVETGELLALTSFPEYDNQAFTDGDMNRVAAANTDDRIPLLNRAISGLYAPGSIVKPLFAAAALHEKVISPDKVIVSTGAITIPNPYDPEKPTVFKDWTVHGPVDMRTAIAVSSDEYFYTIGGGYGAQKGLGIERLDNYARMFGLAATSGIALFGEEDGNIPTPEWKEKVFGADDPWRIGNTYHTAIGQYGFQVTPLQALRFTAALANGGKMLIPHLTASSTPEYTQLPFTNEELEIVKDGMRLAVTSSRTDATVKSLYIAGIQIAGKSGTAQIGTHNQYMNSWVVGFWPAENPRFAFATVLEKAKAGTLSGAAPGMVPFFTWLVEHHPEYLR